MEGSSIVRSDDLRSENRRRLLSALRSKGPISSALLASETGLSAAAISSLTSQLSEQGIICCSRQKHQGTAVGRGRPQTLNQLNSDAGDVITLVLSIDLIRVSRINYAGLLLSRETLELNTRELSEAGLMDTLVKAIAKAIQTQTSRPVQRIGVAFQGLTDKTNGTLLWSPIIQQQKVHLGASLKKAFDVPVSVNNDSLLICEALSQSQEALLGNSFAAIVFSHGVGLGLQINGKPFSGIHSSALELGHLRFERNGALCRCGKRGCIEAYAADYGILRLATGESIHEHPPGRLDGSRIHTLAAAANDGDEAAIQAFAIAGAAIGEGLATLFTLLDPMPVALVGRSSAGTDLMRMGMISALRELRDGKVVVEDMLHCFDEEDPLLEQGLMHNTLTEADSHFAFNI